MQPILPETTGIDIGRPSQQIWKLPLMSVTLESYIPWYVKTAILHPTQPHLRSKTGAAIADINGNLSRWVEHFTDLLNRENRLPSLDAITPANLPYTINFEPLTRNEITTIINSLKNHKSPSEDGIPAEIYKACSSTLLEPLHSLFCFIWDEEIFPQARGTSILLPIYKKGANLCAKTTEASVCLM